MNTLLRTTLLILFGTSAAISLCQESQSSTTKSATSPAVDSTLKAKSDPAGDFTEKIAQALNDRRISIDDIKIPERAGEKKIHAALNSVCSINIPSETPLDSAMQTIATEQNIQIRVNRKALDEIGLSADTPVTFSVQDVLLRDGLELLLEELGLTYTVRNGLLDITTMEAAQENQTTEVYGLTGKLANKAVEVVEVIQTVCAPDTWEVTVGGPSSIVPMDDLLIVNTTTTVHYEIQELLTKLVSKYDPKK